MNLGVLSFDFFHFLAFSNDGTTHSSPEPRADTEGVLPEEQRAQALDRLELDALPVLLGAPVRLPGTFDGVRLIWHDLFGKVDFG